MLEEWIRLNISNPAKFYHYLYKTGLIERDIFVEKDTPEMKLFQYVYMFMGEMQQKTKEEHSNIDMKQHYSHIFTIFLVTNSVQTLVLRAPQWQHCYSHLTEP